MSKASLAEPGARGPLRVLIEQRTGEVRNMLHLDELLSQCNAAGMADPSKEFACRSFTFTGDLKRYPLPPTGLPELGLMKCNYPLFLWKQKTAAPFPPNVRRETSINH